MVLAVTIREAGPELFMTVDGQELIPLRQGDRIRIRGYEKSLCFARLDPVPGYFAKLRTIGLV
jgi:NAD kinase